MFLSVMTVIEPAIQVGEYGELGRHITVFSESHRDNAVLIRNVCWPNIIGNSRLDFNLDRVLDISLHFDIV